MKLIVGLGNPGEKYANVRHNLGFMVVDELVDRLQVTGDSWEDNKNLKSQICNLKTENYNLILAMPQTYMNNSGLAVKLLTDYYHLPFTNLVIIHDDLDLLLGKIKIRMGGAAGGHHGVESIISALGTDQFTRIKVGIGNEKSHLGEHQRQHFNAEHFVLEPFMAQEKSKVKHAIKMATKALTELLNSSKLA